jgi:hypothetical protein
MAIRHNTQKTKLFGTQELGNQQVGKYLLDSGPGWQLHTDADDQYCRGEIMKVFTRGWIVLMLLAFTLPGISHAQTTILAGKWRITWLANGKPVSKPNTIKLTESINAGKMTNFSGTFISDDGEKCAVAGHKSNDTDRQLDMKVTCAAWSISITGTVAVDGQQINGGYTVHYPSGPSLGDYVMDKIVCMLPEGCGN